MGYIAEVGVHQGDGAVRLRDAFPKDELFLFDTFQGHDAPSEFDNPISHPKGRYADTSFEKVQDRLKWARIVPGRIQDTAKEVEHIRWKFVRIDVDQYLPTKFACEFFKTRMEPGGIIEFDDYKIDDCPGATLAINEVFGQPNIIVGYGNFPTNSWHWKDPRWVPQS